MGSISCQAYLLTVLQCSWLQPTVAARERCFPLGREKEEEMEEEEGWGMRGETEFTRFSLSHGTAMWGLGVWACGWVGGSDFNPKVCVSINTKPRCWSRVDMRVHVWFTHLSPTPRLRQKVIDSSASGRFFPVSLGGHLMTIDRLTD